MSGTHVAFLRGINVGRANRVAMAELRALIGELGCREVRTVLNSGNVVFAAPDEALGAVEGGHAPAADGPGGGPLGSRASAEPDPAARALARRISEALRDRTGVSANVVVLKAADFHAFLRENRLLDVADDPSRLLVGIPEDASDLGLAAPLAERDWFPEAFQLGRRAAFLWCPVGFVQSALRKEFERLLGDRVTIRNWSTLSKVREVLES